MTGKCFVDTNILVYAHDRSAGTKHQRALRTIERLWATAEGVLSTQILQEFCFNLRRRIAPPMPIEEVRRILQDYMSWEVVVNDAASILHALDIEVRYKISFWDALVLQAAESSGAVILYSEDFTTGRHYGGVLVVNPLIE